MQQSAPGVCQIFLFLLFTLPLVLLLYATLRRVLNEPFSRSDALPCVLLLYVNLLTNRAVAAMVNGLNILTSLLCFFVMVRFVFRRRGMECFTAMLRVVVLLCAEEAMCMLVVYLCSLLGISLSHIMVVTLADFYRTESLFCYSLINCTGAQLVLLLIMGWQGLRSHSQKQCPCRHSRKGLYLRSCTRVALLVFSGLGMLTMPFTLYGGQSLIAFLIEYKEQYVLLCLCCLVLMLTAFSYLAQDLRYILQQDRLQTLQKQQTLSEDLLQRQRFFRHNMVNMLYGLDGLILSGDTDKLSAYYGEMRQRCALTNNDNIAALGKITNAALNTLLLQHMDSALQQGLPLNLYVGDGLVIPRVLSDAELCQVLGVLLDNAIEAAKEADEPSLVVEMCNVDGGLEVLVKNTYAGQVDPGLLASGGSTTKEGHAGQGLASCYHLLARTKGGHLNFWVTGQYVQAQLLLVR